MLLQAAKRHKKSNAFKVLLLLPSAAVAATGDSLLVSVETKSSQKKNRQKMPRSD
jgi:hypothetical protein